MLAPGHRRGRAERSIAVTWGSLGRMAYRSDWVALRHPLTDGAQLATRKAYRTVWRRRGWIPGPTEVTRHMEPHDAVSRMFFAGGRHMNEGLDRSLAVNVPATDTWLDHFTASTEDTLRYWTVWDGAWEVASNALRLVSVTGAASHNVIVTDVGDYDGWADFGLVNVQNGTTLVVAAVDPNNYTYVEYVESQGERWFDIHVVVNGDDVWGQRHNLPVIQMNGTWSIVKDGRHLRMRRPDGTWLDWGSSGSSTIELPEDVPCGSLWGFGTVVVAEVYSTLFDSFRWIPVLTRASSSPDARTGSLADRHRGNAVDVICGTPELQPDDVVVVAYGWEDAQADTDPTSFGHGLRAVISNALSRTRNDTYAAVRRHGTWMYVDGGTHHQYLESGEEGDRLSLALPIQAHRPKTVALRFFGGQGTARVWLNGESIRVVDLSESDSYVVTRIHLQAGFNVLEMEVVDGSVKFDGWTIEDADPIVIVCNLPKPPSGSVAQGVIDAYNAEVEVVLGEFVGKRVIPVDFVDLVPSTTEFFQGDDLRSIAVTAIRAHIVGLIDDALPDLPPPPTSNSTAGEGAAVLTGIVDGGDPGLTQASVLVDGGGP